MMNPNQNQGSGNEWPNNGPTMGAYPPPYSAGTQNPVTNANPPTYGFAVGMPPPASSAPIVPNTGNPMPASYPVPYAGGSSAPYPTTPVQNQKGIQNPGYGVEPAGFQQNVPPVGFYNPPVNNSPYDSDQTEPKYEDYEGQHLAGMDFSEKTIRRAFIRKVYSILSVQLLTVVGFIALFLYNDSVRGYTHENPGIVFGALGVYFVTFLIMVCCEGARRKAPHNFIFLGIFTLASAVMLGVISASYNEGAVLLAIGVTVIVTVALTIFSFQTKVDFTRFGGMMFVLLIVLILFGFMTIFLRHQFPIIRMVYACCGALLFSFFLIHDTQLMIGGEHKYSISPEEYIFAALTLYLDIINIFLYLLRIFGNK